MDKHLPKIDDIKHRVKELIIIYIEKFFQKSTILKQELCSLFQFIISINLIKIYSIFTKTYVFSHLLYITKSINSSILN